MIWDVRIGWVFLRDREGGSGYVIMVVESDIMSLNFKEFIWLLLKEW